MTSDPLTVAFYLPQFHAIPENDAWWGEGFTEWTNVRRAKPLFDGHAQPFLPRSDTGYYDLRNPEVLRSQFAMAAAHGIDAFCFYHYWFNGKRLLERPVDQFLSSDIAGRFCLSWANENWTRRWDGRNREILISQVYDSSTPLQVFASFLPALRDPRYLRIDNRAVLLVHRADHLPDARRFASVWRDLAKTNGVGELLILAAETVFGLDPRRLGFDGVVEFPPVGANDLSTAAFIPPRGLSADFRGRLMSYPRLHRKYASRVDPPFVRYRGVTPSWDNTARRGKRATVFIDASVDEFGRWVAESRLREAQRFGGTGAIFVNAWNEWAEGAVLEASEHSGLDLLRAVGGLWPNHARASRRRQGLGRPNFGFVYSLLLLTAGSVKHLGQRLRRRRRKS